MDRAVLFVLYSSRGGDSDGLGPLDCHALPRQSAGLNVFDEEQSVCQTPPRV
jgi:hypothetical protein